MVRWAGRGWHTLDLPKGAITRPPRAPSCTRSVSGGYRERHPGRRSVGRCHYRGVPHETRVVVEKMTYA
jgi:hypothetical protein